VAVPATSVRVPKLVEVVIPEIEAVPERVIFPVARDVPELGRTLIPDQVILARALGLPEALSEDAMVMVIVLAATVAVVLLTVSRVEFPESRREIATLTAELVSKLKPDGAFKIKVPVLTSPLLASSRIGPVKAVYAPPVLSALIAPPPVATIFVAAQDDRDPAPTINAIARNLLVIFFIVINLKAFTLQNRTAAIWRNTSQNRCAPVLETLITFQS
jgi:hypothetical protein